MTLKIAQTSAPKNSTYWDWSVWIEGSDTELDGVKEVIWKLHPTFSPSVYRSSARSEKFKLNTSGWGEFTIYAEVKNKNGKSKSLRHWLTLEPSIKPDAASSIVPTQTNKAQLRIKGAQPAVFLSYSLNYATLAAHLTKALEKKNFSVTRDIDIAQGVEVNRWIKEQVNKSDAVILLGAEEARSFSNTEIQFAQSNGVPIIPVTLGAMQKHPPSKIGNMTSLYIGDGSPKEIAPGLAQKLSKLLP